MVSFEDKGLVGQPAPVVRGQGPSPVLTDGPLSAEWWTDPATLHINMLRGGVAKLTAAQIGHLYRGAEAAAVVAEVLRQNPGIQPDDAVYGLVNAARRHMATHPVYRSRRVGNEGSQARLEQEDKIFTEDALRAAIQAALAPAENSLSGPQGTEAALSVHDEQS